MWIVTCDRQNLGTLLEAGIVFLFLKRLGLLVFIKKKDQDSLQNLYFYLKNKRDGESPRGGEAVNGPRSGLGLT